jgi:hypothetical protein
VLLQPKNMRARIIYLILFILLNLGIVFEFQWLFYEKEGINYYLLIAIIALINPLLVYLILKNFQSRGVIAFVSFFILALIHTLIHENYTEYQLEYNGEEISGVITDKKWSPGNRGRQGEWLIRGRFEYKNVKYYTFFEPLLKADKNINDSILILFSIKNPDINRIQVETDY